MKKGYWCYWPVILVIALGYFIGGYLSFGVKYLNLLPEIQNQSARMGLMLFGLGMLGATTHCSFYWSKDIDEVVYRDSNFEPHFFDFFGYMSMIIEGGVTGVILYLLVKTGIGITISANEVNLNLPSSLVIAYCGGLFHFKVIDRLSKFAKDILTEGIQNKSEKD